MATLDPIHPPEEVRATDGARRTDRIRALDGGHVFDRIRALDRIRLRRAAKRYAARGWPVFPGACLARGTFACGRPGCPVTSCHPAVEAWETAASCEVARVADWWRERPYGLLLATGRAFDVLEVPAYLGHRVLAASGRPGPRRPGPRGVGSHRAGADPAAPRRAGAGADPETTAGPVAVTPAGRWMFLVRPGEPLRPELDECFYVLRHGRDSWIPAPPTRLREGTVRWAVPPSATGWRLPESAVLQRVLVEALRAAGRTLPSAPLPGQVPPPLLPEPFPRPGSAPKEGPAPVHRPSHRASHRAAPAEAGQPPRRGPASQRSWPVRARHRS